ncbi:hypothetical protein SKPI104516_05495 [Skermania piniformis]
MHATRRLPCRHDLRDAERRRHLAGLSTHRARGRAAVGVVARLVGRPALLVAGGGRARSALPGDRGGPARARLLGRAARRLRRFASLGRGRGSRARRRAGDRGRGAARLVLRRLGTHRLRIGVRNRCARRDRIRGRDHRGRPGCAGWPSRGRDAARHSGGVRGAAGPRGARVRRVRRREHRFGPGQRHLRPGVVRGEPGHPAAGAQGVVLPHGRPRPDPAGAGRAGPDRARPRRSGRRYRRCQAQCRTDSGRPTGRIPNMRRSCTIRRASSRSCMPSSTASDNDNSGRDKRPVRRRSTGQAPCKACPLPHPVGSPSSRCTRRRWRSPASATPVG